MGAALAGGPLVSVGLGPPEMVRTQAMDGASNRRPRKVKVERDYVPSRLGTERLVAAYERVVPVPRRVAAEASMAVHEPRASDTSDAMRRSHAGA